MNNISTQTWNKDGIAYVMADNSPTVPSDNTLTVKPGGVIKFADAANLYVNGTLNATGTPTDRTYFTSINDDIGGDTNATTTPAEAGNWGRIQIGSGATTTLAYTFVGYGGYSDGYMLYNNGGAMMISHSEIASSTSYGIKQGAGTLVVTKESDVHGQDYGIYASGGSLTVKASDIHSNTYGIYSSTDKTTIDVTKLHGNSYGFYVAGGMDNTISSSEIYNNTDGVRVTGGNAYIGSNSIHDNSSYGVNNTNGAGSTVNATYNYWGASNGPSGQGAGSGDAVSTYVNFDNYLATEHYILVNSSGDRYSSVDEREIRWDWGDDAVTSSDTLTAWYSSLGTWNNLGSINIATDTVLTFEDLAVSSTTRSDIVNPGWWSPRTVSWDPDTLTLNAYWLDGTPTHYQQWVITHELGHALGLGHSYTGNIMDYIVPNDTSDPSLGDQDESDYNYLWP